MPNMPDTPDPRDPFRWSGPNEVSGQPGQSGQPEVPAPPGSVSQLPQKTNLYQFNEIPGTGAPGTGVEPWMAEWLRLQREGQGLRDRTVWGGRAPSGGDYYVTVQAGGVAYFGCDMNGRGAMNMPGGGSFDYRYPGGQKYNYQAYIPSECKAPSYHAYRCCYCPPACEPAYAQGYYGGYEGYPAGYQGYPAGYQGYPAGYQGYPAGYQGNGSVYGPDYFSPYQGQGQWQSHSAYIVGGQGAGPRPPAFFPEQALNNGDRNRRARFPMPYYQ